jgi:hypothetical protein
MSDLFLEISDHKTRFLIIDHPDSQTGDYGLIVDDMGPRIRIATDHLPDALSRGAYAVDIAAADGSGSFAFSSDPLPQGLALDPSGRLRGELTIAPGVYPLTITVKDLIHEGITDTRRFDLSVVRFFPDAFEALNDDGPGTENTMTPGTAPQTHCFHDDKDLDWVRLDLHAIEPGDRIIVKTSGLSEPVQTGLRLLDDQNRVMATAGGTPETTLVFDCARPAVYRLEIRETQSRIGDYKLIVSNSGQPLTLSTATLTHAESDRPHRQTLDVLGGCGRYRFVIDEGALPPGLTLDEHTGLITGRNTHWGTFTLTIRIDDRLFAENHTRRTYTMDAFMGRKLSGKTRFVFPHYQTGTFSMTALTTTTRAFPGTLHGGTPGNLRYRIIDHTVPLDRFTLAFDTRTGELTLTEPGPVSCNRYTPDDLDVAVEVSDRVYTNNRFVFHYDIPARCLSY